MTEIHRFLSYELSRAQVESCESRREATLGRCFDHDDFAIRGFEKSHLLLSFLSFSLSSLSLSLSSSLPLLLLALTHELQVMAILPAYLELCVLPLSSLSFDHALISLFNPQSITPLLPLFLLSSPLRPLPFHSHTLTPLSSPTRPPQTPRRTPRIYVIE